MSSTTSIDSSSIVPPPPTPTSGGDVTTTTIAPETTSSISSICYQFIAKGACEAFVSTSNANAGEKVCTWYCPRSGAPSAAACRCIDKANEGDPIVVVFGVIGALLFLLLFILGFHFCLKRKAATTEEQEKAKLLKLRAIDEGKATREQKDRRQWYLDHKQRTASGGASQKELEDEGPRPWGAPVFRRSNFRYDTKSNASGISKAEDPIETLRNATTANSKPPQVIRTDSVRKTFLPGIGLNESTSNPTSPTAILASKQPPSSSTKTVTEQEHDLVSLHNLINRGKNKSQTVSPPRRRLISPDQRKFEPSISVTTPRGSAKKLPTLDPSVFADRVFSSSSDKHQEQKRSKLQEDTMRIVIPKLEDVPTPEMPQLQHFQQSVTRLCQPQPDLLKKPQEFRDSPSAIRWVTPKQQRKVTSPTKANLAASQADFDSPRTAKKKLLLSSLKNAPSPSPDRYARSSFPVPSQSYSGIVTLSSSSQSSSRASTPPGLSPLATLHHRIERDAKKREQQKLKQESKERRRMLGGQTNSSSSSNSNPANLQKLLAPPSAQSNNYETDSASDQEMLLASSKNKHDQKRSRSSSFPPPSSAVQMKAFHLPKPNGELSYSLL